MLRNILVDPFGIHPSPGTVKGSWTSVDGGKIVASTTIVSGVFSMAMQVLGWIAGNSAFLAAMLGGKSTIVVAVATALIQIYRTLQSESNGGNTPSPPAPPMPAPAVS